MESAFGVDHGEVSKAFSPSKFTVKKPTLKVNPHLNTIKSALKKPKGGVTPGMPTPSTAGLSKPGV